MKSGWKPKRTIVLASWDAEEYGLVGSTEWAEEHAADLQKNAVAYLNGDAVVTGPDLGMVARRRCLRSRSRSSTRRGRPEARRIGGRGLGNAGTIGVGAAAPVDLNAQEDAKFAAGWQRLAQGPTTRRFSIISAFPR